MFHCYTENFEFAQKVLEIAPKAMFSFSGIVTFKSALDIQNAAINLPIENIMVETDSPYLAPAPFRGKENEPSYVKYVLEKIEELRGEKIEGKVLQNTKEFF